MLKPTDNDDKAQQILAQDILVTSATMIGVCAAIIGLVKIVETQKGSSNVDEYTALVLLLFLVSSLTSYLSIRDSTRKTFRARLELVSDVLFLAGLITMSLVALFFAYEII
ncbi:MAG: hypothetical protein GEU95_18855 [Rhizobiales bacterium]|nr:hypothetical protein [Hyphomicrobiales bacterium]